MADDITLGQLEALWAATAANTKAIEELTEAIRDTHGVKKIDSAVTVVGGAAAGASISGNPVYVAGTDGSNARGLLLDASGRPIVTGAAAENAAVAGNPVLIGGRYDSTPRTLGDGDVGALALDSAGRAQVTLQGRLVQIAHLAQSEVVGAGTTLALATVTDPPLAYSLVRIAVRWDTNTNFSITLVQYQRGTTATILVNEMESFENKETAAAEFKVYGTGRIVANVRNLDQADKTLLRAEVLGVL